MLTGIKVHLVTRPVLFQVYRVGLTIIGGALVITGVILLVTPGPGWLTILLGLRLLASEYSGAERLYGRLYTWSTTTLKSLSSRAFGRSAEQTEPPMGSTERSARKELTAGLEPPPV